MKALIRTISEYTDADLLLGVFSSAKAAASARAEYIARYKSGAAKDPWARQAYHAANLRTDVMVVPMRACPACLPRGRKPERLIVVSGYAEGFGQRIRTLDSAHGSPACAKKSKAKAKRKSQVKGFPAYALLQEIQLDRLACDAADEQPCL
ncbi:MAG: hypothetical protein HY077_18350 [Elusimicrobia bacterium]|nr:hypothetical protein [Elusimicrobiota bacterium]